MASGGKKEENEGRGSSSRRKSTRRICQQEALTSVSKVIDYNLKWKSRFEQRRKGYEKIQSEITKVESWLSLLLSCSSPKCMAWKMLCLLAENSKVGSGRGARIFDSSCSHYHLENTAWTHLAWKSLHFSFNIFYGLLVWRALCALLRQSWKHVWVIQIIILEKDIKSIDHWLFFSLYPSALHKHPSVMIVNSKNFCFTALYLCR